MSSGDADGWVHCACGQKHWGKYGAAGLLVVRIRPRQTATVLLQRRAAWTHQGNTWGFPGGAIDSRETACQAALREAYEELRIPATAVRVHNQLCTTGHEDWRYTVVLAELLQEVRFRPNPETLATTWVSTTSTPPLRLHPALAIGWSSLMAWVTTTVPSESASTSSYLPSVGAPPRRDGVR